ncbi:MAG: HypC/HybG/HupF family hydrogenase formation chaperone [Coriobacteriales bacterium]|jgi:hydrogenase expression/formation protein HypC
MCLAVPSKIVSIDDGGIAQIDVLGVRRDCSVRLTPNAKPGDYVLVHAGFAIQVVEEQEADETLRLLQEMSDRELAEITGQQGADAPAGEPAAAPAAAR